jgi:hypothetical protein
MSQGRGISDAVRNSVREWIDPVTSDKVAKAAKISDGLARLVLRNPDNWARTARRFIKNGLGTKTGHSRTYRCNGLEASSKVELEAQTNVADDVIQYFVVRVNGKVIEGGVSNVTSVFKKGVKNQARVAVAFTTSAETKTAGFRHMSEEELRRLQTEVDFDSFADLFEVRE